MTKRLLTILLAVLLVLGVGSALAQTDTGSASSVTIFFVACESNAIINLSGTMETGLDLYYQVFSGPQGAGTPLTNLRQVQVDGTYAFSESVTFTGGTIPAGSIGSARVFMAREGAPNSVASDIFLVDDLQDGCNNAQNPLGSSIDTGASGAGAVSGSTTSSGVRVRSPFGGFINPGTTPEPPVVLGARSTVANRSATAGQVFAECDQYPGSGPGVLFDNDNIVVFWSWFARTAAQVEDHQAKAQYAITLNRAPLIEVVTTPISRPSANYWVFYYANIGRLKPGQYAIEFKLSWSEPTSDGYEDFGPGTDNESFESSCNFTVEPNPDNEVVTNHNLIYSVR